MAEAAAGFDIRRTLYFAGVGLVVLFAVLFFFFRSCVASSSSNDYTTIYSNLDLNDAAKVVAQLKKINIPYKLGNQGSSILVPKSQADQAKIGLAEKQLPAGGVVGWEIFDESKLGATDFDRRIQLIRAISGELSRTINRIEGVERARVQIVIPETRLFATTAPPVTASVMLRLKAGFELSPSKIAGIVYLVASSVENLQPQNVTVIDDTGKILTPLEMAGYTSTTPETMVIKEEITSQAETIEVLELPASQEVSAENVTATVAAQPVLSVEERIMLKVKAKRQLENDLAGKAQEILNRFYPPQSAIVKLNIEFKDTRLSGEGVMAVDDLKIKNLNIVILIDNRVDFKEDLKQATYKSVAGAVGYDRKRGDKIILQRVPFHLATPPPSVVGLSTQQVVALSEDQAKTPVFAAWSLGWLWLFIGLLVLVVILLVYRLLFGRALPKPELSAILSPPLETVPASHVGSVLGGIKSMVEQNPERVAEVLKTWLSEEKEA